MRTAWLTCLILWWLPAMTPLGAAELDLDTRNGFSAQALAYADAALPDAELDLAWKPELFAEYRPWPEWRLSADLSLDNQLRLLFDGADSEQSLDFRLYRAWAALAWRRTELKAGLQHIRMGPAQILRPLQWFDRIAPASLLRDTEGVMALTLTHFFPQPELRLWLIRGNGGTKGAELLPTPKGVWEAGGRLGVLNPLGDTGLSAHWRRLENPITEAQVWEWKLGWDHRLDLAFGAWLEAALELRDIEIPSAEETELPRQSLNATLGLDYTFGVGNGLYVLTEQNLQVSGSQPVKYTDARGQAALLLSYPLGLLDGLQLLATYDYIGRRGLGTLAWRRVYDLLSWELAISLDAGLPARLRRTPSLRLTLNYDL